MTYLDMLGPEGQSQVAVVNYLRLKYPLALFIHPAQETYTKSKFQKFKNKVIGVRAGVPDLLIFDPMPWAKGLAIEMKYGKNKVTKEQSDFLTALAERGWRTHVCYSSADACRVIDDYFWSEK